MSIFPLEILEKIAFPKEKQADVLTDTNTQDTTNKEHQGENAIGHGEEIQELQESDGSNFSEKLTNFLQKKDNEPKREEKVEKAEALGFPTGEQQPQQ